MSYKIVVARYNESIEWLKPQMKHCLIINKGTPLNIIDERLRPNLGRESESYLWYIIHHYNSLPDVIIFTQANIADHKGRNDISILMKLRLSALIHGKSKATMKHNEYNNQTWGPQWNIKNGEYHLKENYKNNEPIVFINWFQRYIEPEYPESLHIYMNAIFAVKKEHILKHPKSYYETLIEQVNHHINPSEGHFFERSWYYIFR